MDFLTTHVKYDLRSSSVENSIDPASWAVMQKFCIHEIAPCLGFERVSFRISRMASRLLSSGSTGMPSSRRLDRFHAAPAWWRHIGMTREMYPASGALSVAWSSLAP